MSGNEVIIKNKKLKELVRTQLHKSDDDIITTDDINRIKSLKLELDLSESTIGELKFFENLESLSISCVGKLKKNEIDILNSLSKLRSLTIYDAELDFEDVEYLNSSLEDLTFVNCKGVNLKTFAEKSGVRSLRIINCKDTDYRDVNLFEHLEELYLPNNKDLNEEDIKYILNNSKSKELSYLNLDGNNLDLGQAEPEGIEISKRAAYVPVERKSWDTDVQKEKKIKLSDIILNQQETDLANGTIVITKEDLELLKDEQGRETLRRLSKSNKIDIFAETTADLSETDLEEIGKVCSVNRVHVGTGWKTTQDLGYDFLTYSKIKKEIVKMIADISPEMSDEEKYRIIHDKICDRIKYDYGALRANSSDHDYYASRNLENGLLGNTCVCAGYADILKNVLAEVGIVSRYVEGRTDTGEYHAWNQVCIRGKDGEEHWQNADITWDACEKGKNYYLVSDEKFNRTHNPCLENTEGHIVNSCPEMRQVEYDDDER